MPHGRDGPAPAQRPPAAGPAEREATAGRKTSRAAPLLPAAGLLLLLGWVFRRQIATGLSVTFGDRFDGFIAIAIQEHWFAVLSGTAPAAMVPWFAGTPGSLGFNDIYLLHGLGYALARAFGADPFLAAEAVNALLLASLYAGLVVAARAGLGLPWLWATAAGLIGAGGSALVQDMHHAQFFALGPMAWALLLGGAALCRLAAGQRAAGLAGLAGVLAGLVLATAAYVALTLLLFAALALGLGAALAPRAALGVLRARGLPAALLAAAAGFLAFALPVLALYLPLLGGAADFFNARHMAPSPLDLLRVGPASLLWGWLDPLLAAAPSGLRPRTPLVPKGLPPLLWLAVLAALPLALRAARGGDGAARLVLALAGAALGLVLLSVDWRGLWLWPAAVGWVPGVGSMRAVARVQMLLAPVLALVAAWAAWRIATALPRLAAPALAAVLVLDQAILASPARLQRSAELARLAALPPPPAGCRAFVAARPREGLVSAIPRSGDEGDRIGEIYSHNTDAMLLAALLRLPTVNGFSTLLPPGWRLADANAPDYLWRASDAARRAGLLEGLCGVDFHALSWSPPGAPLPVQRRGEVPIEPRTRHPVVPGSPAGAWLARGFAESEPWGTWTEGEVADLLIPLPEGWRGGVIRLELRAFAPWRHERSVLLRTAEEAFPADIPTGSVATLFLPVRQPRLFALRIEVSDPASPRELGLGADPRRLGVALIAITLLPEGE
jgi:hypothetical protein